MSEKLVKDYYEYDYETSRPAGKRFGLRMGQIVSHLDRSTKNGFWFNQDGEKIGWGDLTSRDLGRIASELDTLERFIVLSEADATMYVAGRTSERPDGAADSIEKLSPDEQRLYTYIYNAFIIAPNHVYSIEGRRFNIASGSLHELDNCSVEMISNMESLHALVLSDEDRDLLRTFYTQHAERSERQRELQKQSEQLF